MNPKFVRTGSKEFVKEIMGLFKWADKAYLCVSYARYDAFKIINSAITQFLRMGGHLRSLFDIERHFTDPSIIMELSTIPGHSECRVYLRGSLEGVAGVNMGPLHTKLYIFQKDDSIRVVLGSSNFTVGGMEVNEEANILLTGAVNEPFFSQIVDYFQLLWGSPCSLLVADNAELLAQYEGLVQEERKQHKESLKKRATLEKQFTKLLDRAKAQEEVIWNSDGAYLLGLALPPFIGPIITSRFRVFLSSGFQTLL